MKSKLTKEWSLFNPKEGYEKEMQDIKLFNGDIILMCWPNAGIWNICKKQGNEKYYHSKEEIKAEEAEFVRLAHDEEWLPKIPSRRP